MQKIFKCPVCGEGLSAPVQDICPVCGWDCGNDITLSLSLNEFSQAEREEYDSRLANAKKLWQKKKDEKERRKINEQEKEKKEKENTGKCTDLKNRTTGLMRNQKWSEALKLLDKLDRLNAGDKWAAEQRRKIQEIQDSEQRELEARCSVLRASINGSIDQRQWTEAIELLDEYDRLKTSDSWSAEQRRKIQAFRDNVRREAEERSNTLKSRIRAHVQQYQWPEALKLLDEYDRLIIGNSWSAEQRKLIQDRMSFRSPPRPVPAQLPTHGPKPSHQDRALRKSGSSYLWIFLVIGVVVIAAIVGIRNLGTVQRIMPVQDQANENLDLSDFYLIPNHTYTYALVTSITEYVYQGSYQLTTGKWKTTQVTHDGNKSSGCILPYSGSRQLLRDLERMYLGPDANINSGIDNFTNINNTSLDFNPTCNCFIQIGSDLYLGYDEDRNYYTKHFIFSEDKPIKMGGLVCSRDVVNLSEYDGYRTSAWWRSGSNPYLWRHDQWDIGYIPNFDYQVVIYEAINDIPINRGILGTMGFENYDQYEEFLGVNNISKWAVMISKEHGIAIITMDRNLYVGAAYVLVD